MTPQLSKLLYSKYKVRCYTTNLYVLLDFTKVLHQLGLRDRADVSIPSGYTYNHMHRINL
jgi:hypothetical protein